MAKKAKSSTNEQVPCPECGEKFWNNKALGGHRHWKHGVQGQRRGKLSARERQVVAQGVEMVLTQDHRTLLNAMEEMTQELNRLWALEEEYKRVVGLAQELSARTIRTLQVAQSN